MHFCSGATRLSGRFSEGFSLRRLHLLGCRLIMPEPEADGSQLCHSEIVEGEAIEASADVPEVLELVEEALDEVALFVGPLGEGNVIGSVGFGRDAGSAILVLDDVAYPVGVIGTIGEHDGTLGQIVEEQLRHRGIVGLSGRELKLHRQAVADDTGMQFAGQSSTTSTDTNAGRLFFWAAAC